MQSKKIRSLAFSFYHNLIKRDRWGTVRNSYNINQWNSFRSNEHLQYDKLTKILTYCNNYVPYYAEVFKSRNITRAHLSSPSILKELPRLDKQLIRKNFTKIQSTKIAPWRIQKCSTSGSTGESLVFHSDVASAIMHAAAVFRNFSWCGSSPFEKHAMLWGARFDESINKTIGNKFREWCRPLLFLSSYEINEEKMSVYAKQLEMYCPHILTSYPSALERFAYFCKENNIRIPSLCAIICSAEQLDESQRDLFREVYNVPVFNRYGSREFGSLAQECSEHNGLHVNMERVIIEVLRNDGSDCKENEVGELVVTDLDNAVMPFIRYRTGDMGLWSARKCPCGRGLKMLERIEGRVFDLIYTPSGSAISGTFWTLVLKYISSDILSFQIRQMSITTVVILLLMKSKIVLNPAQRNLLKRKIYEVAPDLVYCIHYVDSIPLTKSGKRRFVLGLGYFSNKNIEESF